MEEKEILWGLSDQNTNAEICEKALEWIGKIRFMPAATVKEGRPDCRILDFNRLSDGNLYFMTSKGKPVYQQLMHHPEVVLNTLIDGRYSLRLNAWVKEVNDRKIWDEFFSLNPGTMKMYRKNPDIIALMTIERGEGEMFHLYEAERIRRVRFTLGEDKPRPMTYDITEDCIGCGICRENCVEHAIHETADGKFTIRKMDCDDCGICYTSCPDRDTALICGLDLKPEGKKS